MRECPRCGEEVFVHRTETQDIVYCEHCFHEEKVDLERPRSRKTDVAVELPMWRQQKKESHPARKGRRRKEERER